MDDFFLQPEMRTEERLSQPGGNVHYERVEQEILMLLQQEESFSYRPYSCRIGAFLEEILVTPKAITIMEGSYSCHPTLQSYYDLRIFLTTEYKVQIERIQKRNGEQQAKIFEERWIPLEEMYFQKYQVEENCEQIYYT